ncbi:MAG: ATP-grasp domain-containing protein [Bacteroidia bacterium]|nr:ATP-grasp domain-containing protein [Bacteroidia bacterium]
MSFATLGISGQEILTESRGVYGENLPYEYNRLIEEGHKYYDRVILINPREVTYAFRRGETSTVVVHDGEDISHLSTLLVRSTRDIEQSAAMLARALAVNGCDIVDTVARFSGGETGKMFSSLRRIKHGTGTTSFFAFSYRQAVAFANTAEYPLILKPVNGRRGEGVYVLRSPEDAMVHINAYFPTDHSSFEKPLFFQEFMDFVVEYRAFIIDGQCIGLARKTAQAGSFTPNAAQGGTFEAAFDPEAAAFVEMHVRKNSILGVDVARTADGDLHIIESNQSPQWQAFEQATGINVAEQIIRYAVDRLNVPAMSI